jgi:hypothetical protein
MGRFVLLDVEVDLVLLEYLRGHHGEILGASSHSHWLQIRKFRRRNMSIILT